MTRQYTISRRRIKREIVSKRAIDDIDVAECGKLLNDYFLRCEGYFNKLMKKNKKDSLRTFLVAVS